MHKLPWSSKEILPLLSSSTLLHAKVLTPPPECQTHLTSFATRVLQFEDFVKSISNTLLQFMDIHGIIFMIFMGLSTPMHSHRCRRLCWIHRGQAHWLKCPLRRSPRPEEQPKNKPKRTPRPKRSQKRDDQMSFGLSLLFFSIPIVV